MRITARRAGVALGVALLLVGLQAGGARAADENASPWLGVYSQNLTQELRDGLQYDGGGVLINRVVPDSPADRAGLEKGDVVVRVGLRSIDSPAELARVIRTARVGQSVSIEVVRDGEKRTLDARLEARPEEGDPGRWEMLHREDFGPGDSDHRVFSFGGPGDLEVFGLGRGRLGVRIETLNPDLGAYFDARDGKGVLIVEVLKDTPAEKAGLKAGDVITRVNGDVVNDADELVKAIGSAEGRVSLTVKRHGSQRTIFAELGEKKEPRILRYRGQDHPIWRMQVDGIDRQDLEKQIEELRDQVKELKKEVEKLTR